MRLDRHEIQSEALRGNPLGDPHERPLWISAPDGDGPWPAIYVVQGMTGRVDMWLNRNPMRKTIFELLDEDPPEAIVVWVDAYTSLGGSQYLDSPAIGNYHSYLCDEVVPWVDARYPTLAAPQHRGIAGKSSGGYGAMVTPMLRPELFGALATHSGDALFEVCYQREFAPVARVLREQYGGSYERFWEDFRSRPALTRHGDEWLVNTYCMAAAYSAGELPFVPETAELRPEVFARWLEWDPVRMAERHADALRGLRGIWIDAGTRDEYHLELGAIAFRAALARVGVTDTVHFELFADDHQQVEYRYPAALRWLADRLRGDPVSVP